MDESISILKGNHRTYTKMNCLGEIDMRQGLLQVSACDLGMGKICLEVRPLCCGGCKGGGGPVGGQGYFVRMMRSRCGARVIGIVRSCDGASNGCVF